MSKKSQDLLLRRAEHEFLKGDYSNALRSYGLILKDYPALGDAKVGAYLSDLGTESQEEAQALFEYYQIIKNEKENAVEIIDGLIDSLDSTKQQLHELFNPMEEIKYGDGVQYSDFLLLVESRKSFRKAFEDVMFSTKVVISNKDEFIDFVTQLLNEGFADMALNYLDATTNIFANDQDVLALYNLLERR